MICLVAILSVALWVSGITSQEIEPPEPPEIEISGTAGGMTGGMAGGTAAGMMGPQGCSCAIRCCPDAFTLRRMPPYTNMPQMSSIRCCGCIFCPSFIGHGPFIPMNAEMEPPEPPEVEMLEVEAPEGSEL